MDSIDQQDQPDMQQLLDDLQQQILDLQNKVSVAQQGLSQFQNTSVSGVGSVAPTPVRAGIGVPPVRFVTATVLGNTAGQTRVALSFVEPESGPTTVIDHYNIYVKAALAQQLQPTLVASTRSSPAVFTFQPDAANATTLFVQTVLSNGQANVISNCPTTTITAQPVIISNMPVILSGQTGSLLMNSFGFANNSPGAGSISWSSAVVSFNGTIYTVAAGNTANAWIYWQAASPTSLQSSAAFPTLGINDFLVCLNNVGEAMMVAAEAHNSSQRAYVSPGAVAVYNGNGKFCSSIAKASGAAGAGNANFADGTGAGGLGSGVRVSIDGNLGKIQMAGFNVTSAAGVIGAQFTGYSGGALTFTSPSPDSINVTVDGVARKIPVY